jgi:hypothetical protein
MTEQYISGYLEAVSRVKDIITPRLGGFNSFFSIEKKPSIDLLENVRMYITNECTWFLEHRKIDAVTFYKDISIKPIENWQEHFIDLIKPWTCDEALLRINGRNGYPLSEYLVNSLLKDFFDKQQVNLYKLLPDYGDWPWGDHLSEEFVFETADNIYIMHFGEST